MVSLAAGHVRQNQSESVTASPKRRQTLVRYVLSTSSPTPAAPMVPAADSQPAPVPAVASDAEARPARRAVLGDNPMQTVLAAAVVGLLVFSLTSNRSRIDRLEDTVVAGFAAQDAKIDDIDLKLTALIAALNKVEEVDAAVGGRLLTPGSDSAP